MPTIFILTLYKFDLHVEYLLVTSCNPPMAKSNLSEEGRKKFKSAQRSIKQGNLNMTLSLYVSNVNKPRSYILMTIGHVEQTSSSYDATLSYMIHGWWVLHGFTMTNQPKLYLHLLKVCASRKPSHLSDFVEVNIGIWKPLILVPHQLPMFSSCDAKCSFFIYFYFYGSLLRRLSSTNTLQRGFYAYLDIIIGTRHANLVFKTSNKFATWSY